MNNLISLKLKDIGPVKMCKRVLKSQTHSEGDVPFYKIKTFGGKADAYISNELFEKYSSTYTFPKNGSILISAAGTLGRVVKYKGERAYFQDSNIVWIDNDESILLNDYLYYFYLTKPWQVTSGSTIPRLYNKDIENITITFPKDIDQQRKIVTILKNLDSKIANNNAISKELESMAKTIYDYWFLQFEFPDKDGKPYKSNGGKMVWNDQLKQEIPEGWKVSIVKNILGDYPRTKTIESKEYNLGSLYPIIDQSKDSYICGYTDNKDYVLNVDDAIVFGDHSNKSKYVNFPFARGADGTQILNSNNPRLSNYLLYQEIIALPEIEKGYSRHFKFLKAQNITIPTLDITKKYMSIVSNMLLQQREIIKENQQLQSLRDFLLPMLMNGQVIIED